MIEPICISVPAAAKSLDISEQHFRDTVLPEVETLGIGAARRVVVDSLRQWVDARKASPSATTAAPGRHAGRSTVTGTRSGSGYTASVTGTGTRIAVRLWHRDVTSNGRDHKTVVDTDPTRLRERVSAICARFPGSYVSCDLPRDFSEYGGGVA